MNDETRAQGPGSEVIAATTTTVARYGRRPMVYTPRARSSWRITCEREEWLGRSEPLEDGRRDPDRCLTRIYARVLPFGLTRQQIEAERRRLLALGWSPSEVAVVLGREAA